MKVIFSEEHLRNISETRKRLIKEGKIKLDHVHTQKFKNRISELSKGRKHTEETKLKISQANKGRKPSPLAIQRLRERKGFKHTIEDKKKIAEASNRLWNTRREDMTNRIKKANQNPMLLRKKARQESRMKLRQR